MNVITILERTLSHVDSRLMSHGKRVAHLVYSVLKAQNKYSEEEIRDYCLLALIHDIGAYETEIVDRIVKFETGNVWAHSVYGYLFIKYFSPLKEVAPVVLFHHADLATLKYLEPKYHEMAQVFLIADRLDILSQNKNLLPEEYPQHFYEKSDVLYDKNIIELFTTHNVHMEAYHHHGIEEFTHKMNGIPFTEKETQEYLNMLVYSIDFRSRPTVTHTITTLFVAEYLGKKLGIHGEYLQQLRDGALLHDVGKTAIPIEIIEKPGRLEADEMEIMRKHIVFSEEILDGCVEDIVLKIAVRHHEKMNGLGYPRGLTEADLTLSERIMAVADVFSALVGRRSYKEEFPKDKTISILETMMAREELDPLVVVTATENYDEIVAGVQATVEPIYRIYEQIGLEYDEWLDKIGEMENVK